MMKTSRFLLNRLPNSFEGLSDMVIHRPLGSKFNRGVTVRHEYLSTSRTNRLAIGVLIDNGSLGSDMDVQDAALFVATMDELARTIEKLGHRFVAFPATQGKRWNSDPDAEVLDGLIVLSRQPKNDDIAELARSLPVVAMMHDATAAGVPSFFIDIGYHVAVAVQEFHARGHRRMALLYDSNESSAWIGNDMRRGFELAHRMCNMAPDSKLEFCRPQTTEAGAAFYHELQQDFPDVTAVVVYSECHVAGMERAALSRGRPIPEDISVIRIENISNTTDRLDRIAHFRFPIAQMVRDAVGTLQGLMESEAKRDRQIDQPHLGEYVPGESVRSLSGES